MSFERITEQPDGCLDASVTLKVIFGDGATVIECERRRTTIFRGREYFTRARFRRGKETSGRCSGERREGREDGAPLGLSRCSHHVHPPLPGFVPAMTRTSDSRVSRVRVETVTSSIGQRRRRSRVGPRMRGRWGSSGGGHATAAVAATRRSPDAFRYVLKRRPSAHFPDPATAKKDSSPPLIIARGAYARTSRPTRGRGTGERRPEGTREKRKPRHQGRARSKGVPTHNVPEGAGEGEAVTLSYAR